MEPPPGLGPQTADSTDNFGAHRRAQATNPSHAARSRAGTVPAATALAEAGRSHLYGSPYPQQLQQFRADPRGTPTPGSRSKMERGKRGDTAGSNTKSTGDKNRPLIDGRFEMLARRWAQDYGSQSLDIPDYEKAGLTDEEVETVNGMQLNLAQKMAKKNENHAMSVALDARTQPFGPAVFYRTSPSYPPWEMDIDSQISVAAQQAYMQSGLSAQEAYLQGQTSNSKNQPSTPGPSAAPQKRVSRLGLQDPDPSIQQDQRLMLEDKRQFKQWQDQQRHRQWLERKLREQQQYPSLERSGHQENQRPASEAGRELARILYWADRLRLINSPFLPRTVEELEKHEREREQDKTREEQKQIRECENAREFAELTQVRLGNWMGLFPELYKHGVDVHWPANEAEKQERVEE